MRLHILFTSYLCLLAWVGTAQSQTSDDHGEEEYVGMLAHVSNATVQGGVGYKIIPGDLEFEGDQVEVVFRPMHADEDHSTPTTRRLSEGLLTEFDAGLAYHAALDHSIDCPVRVAGEALTAAVDAYSCYTVSVNDTLNETSYTLTISGADGEEVELMVWNFFVATDGHDHAERYLEEDDHHEELLNAFELTSVSTGEPLDLEATYIDGELGIISEDHDHEEEEYVGMLAHVSNATVQGGVGYTIIPGDLEFEGDLVEVVFRPMHADEDHRRLSEDLVAEFANAVAYHAALNHTADCPVPVAGEALTAAVDAYSCYTVPVNPLLQQTSYALTISGADGEEVELLTLNFFIAHENHDSAETTLSLDGHDHDRYLEEDDHHEELFNAFELTSASTGIPLPLEATYVDGSLELSAEDVHDGHDHGEEDSVGMLVYASNAIVQGGIGYNIIPGGILFANDMVEVLFHPLHADEEEGHEGHNHLRFLSEEEEMAEEFAEGVAYHATLDHTADCPVPVAGEALTAAVDAYSCYTVPVNPLLQQTSYALTISGDDEEEIKLFMWNFFFASENENHDSDETASGHDGHDHSRRFLQTGPTAAELANAFVPTSASTGAALPVAATSVNGNLLPAVAEEGSTPAPKWMPYIASLIVNLVTFIGVLFMFPTFRRCMMKNQRTKAIPEPTFNGHGVETSSDLELQKVDSNGDSIVTPVVIGGSVAEDDVFTPAFLAYTSAFSVGAILATTFLLILPEATEMIWNDIGRDQELIEVYWRWGTVLLAGFIFPFVMTILIGLVTANSSHSTRVVAGVLIGDFIHNFTDGTFIAAAFLSCDSAFGWAVAASTIIHELAQEIADYILLTTVGGFTPFKALMLNFLSGTSIIMGCAVVAESDASTDALGYILCFGAGVYISTGATECMPRVFKYATSFKLRIISFLLFAVGATAIGLILLDHKHCEVGGSHDGHNH
ncbi:hypothetical protein TrVE_jg2379 [Triparma verrucosa]|uniref:Uncharacterized protein n=1 Tax=Triparma verrucosa TaxID=1606542 RepID=A0A9W7ERD7_9STRA|nr:hypothetical protein TrVE_jg2379 [Triparma verrucosa]